MSRMNKLALAAATAITVVGAAGAAHAEKIKIGITQNNVGVDSYQTTYEKAFIAAAAKNPDVETVVLDAGGDVARQIGQMQDLIQQKVDVIIIWPTDGKAVVPVVRKAHQAGIPVVVTNSNIAADGRDGYLLLINNGDTVLRGAQIGRDYSVGKGEAALVSASEGLQMTGGDSNVWANVVVPRVVLESAFKQIDDRLALCIGADNEALDMLKRYCSFLEAGPTLLSPDLVNHATETIVDLIGLATGAKGETAELAGLRGLRAARLQAILQKMRENFADPSISAQGVARQLRLSVRYMHDILQETGVSFAERILELRLQKAHRMLSDRRNDGMRISEIALLSGFSDVSYFNRCFRRRFGSTPSGAR